MTASLSWIFLIFWAIASSAACVRDSYSYASILPAPAVTTTTYPGAVAAANTYVRGHWSEMANIGGFRPPNTVQTGTPTGCPHIDTPNMQDWHTLFGSLANRSAVTLPANTAVLISSCSVQPDPTFVYGLITIPATSTLIIGDANIAFGCTGMKVDGKLLMGSPTCRYRNKITITVYGSRTAQTLPALETVKGIFVGGQIDIHGVEYFPTWTRLAKTANIGDTDLFIQDCPNWQPGQSIALITTENKDTRDWQKNEELIISSVYTTGISGLCVVRVTTPITAKHYGGFEYQAEVGLLTRNIKIQGDAYNSEPKDNTPIACTNSAYGPSTYPCENTFLTGFGVHIFVTVPATTARFSGLEVFRGGQTNVMGRYPIHFHMLGNLTAASAGKFWVSDCAVHRSYFRCLTIHGTSGAGSLDNGVTLTKNVGFDIIGHCYFSSEDGVEENNTISYNLGAHIHPLGPFWQPPYGISSGPFIQASGQNFGSQFTDVITGGPANPNLALADDIGASPFYFTNAHVSIFGNAASGGWAGFSFPNLISPVGLHRYAAPYFCPKNRPLILFQGNSAHSTGFWQGHAAGIYLGGNLRHDASGNYEYTTGRFLPARDTCRDYRQGSSVQINWECIDADKLWMQFLDTKVFLANVGLQSWGDREELIRFEVADVSISTNVFGQVWIDRMLVNCRTSHTPVKNSGCTASNIWSCAPNDRQFALYYGGFQFYDTGQSHIVTNSIFKNCQRNHPTCDSGGCNMYIFMYLTHSDEFTPGLMQATKNITYSNIDTAYQTVPSTSTTDGITVSGRNSNWMDWDGTVTGVFPGVRTNIGSNWAGPDWWKYNPSCVDRQQNWICAMSPGDSTASMLVHYNIPQEGNVGGSICGNGNHINCPVDAHVIHFGGSPNMSAAFQLAAMPRLTGPIIASRGGWFLHFTLGTPNSIMFDNQQVLKEDFLHLAIPYPAGTTFSIYVNYRWCSTSSPECSKNPPETWCPTCNHYFTPVSTMAAFRASPGDNYFFNSTGQMLHIRIRHYQSSFSNYPYFAYVNQDKPWNASVIQDYPVFRRGGVDLPVTGGDGFQLYVKVTSNNCNPRCAPITPVVVPAALPLVVVPTFSPTESPTTKAPTAAPTNGATPAPTKAPTSASPTNNPTSAPTSAPTKAPTSNAPTNAPTSSPTNSPTSAPSSAPTKAPSSGAPTNAPSSSPTGNPTKSPTSAPTNAPSSSPTNAPSSAPSGSPTRGPTSSPTSTPTAGPTNAPTNAPTATPTQAPTSAPSNAPTVAPTSPTNAPTAVPVGTPTDAPTSPTNAPTSAPTASPTGAPSASPTVAPTTGPTNNPTNSPTAGPTNAPTNSPTSAPSNAPTVAPTSPTNAPTQVPVGTPTDAPTSPTSAPTNPPTDSPTNGPTNSPTENPTQVPVGTPTSVPVVVPTSQPTKSPSNAPSIAPTSETTDPCNQYTDCNSCLKNSCAYCPKWENPQLVFGCHSPSRTCRRKRFSYCEDTNSQISLNFTAEIKDWVTVTVSSSSAGINININKMEDPVLMNGGLLKVVIHFTSSDSSWSQEQKSQACDIIKSTMSTAYGITPSRVGCSFSKLQKRDNLAINDGQAEVLIAEPGASAPDMNNGDSGIPMWVFIVAAVGGVLLLLALVLVVYLIVVKGNSKKNQWEKY